MYFRRLLLAEGRLKSSCLVYTLNKKVHHIAVLHDILFAFYAHFAGFFGFGFAAERDKVVVGNDLGRG